MRTPPPAPRDDLRFPNTTGILQKKKKMWCIGVEVEQETSAPPPKKNPGSAPARARVLLALLSLRKKRGILIVYIALSKLNVNVTSLVDRLPILASKRIDC